MKFLNGLLLVTLSLFITACSPHPVSGVWSPTQENEYGITRLMMSFDGRAEFITPNLDNANWHCFWSATDKKEAKLICTPSTNTDNEEHYSLLVIDDNHAEFRHDTKLIGTFKLLNENPVISE